VLVIKIKVLSQASPDVLNELPPKLGILHAARFGLDCEPGIPGVHSIYCDNKTVLRNALDGAKCVMITSTTSVGVRSCRSSLCTAFSRGVGSSTSCTPSTGGTVSLTAKGSARGVHQLDDGSFEVRPLDVGLVEGAAKRAKAVDHEVDRLIRAVGHDGRGFWVRSTGSSLL
jgi:hypothetical protein